MPDTKVSNTVSTPFYFDAKEELKNVVVELTYEQQEQRAKDREVIAAIDQYYTPYRSQWRDSGALFNLVQVGTDDVSSNWYMGWARILINHSLAMMTAANPKASFSPRGNQDPKMAILVSALVEDTLRNCNWQSHQRLWIQDLLTFGNGVTESYSERPMRIMKYQRGDKMIDKVVRDFRRSNVGMRRKSPFRCMRSHFISDPDDVPVSINIEELTWNQFVMKYCNALLPDGTKKYDTEQIPVGASARIIHFYDEIENCYRSYCITYGGKPESTPQSLPGLQELGYPIYDKPLSQYKLIQQGREVIGGANAMGMSPLAFATLDDQLDQDMETYSICGMGIPQIIAGPEAVMHGLINMSIDNERLKSTVPISYEPNSQDSPSALDLDVRTMYSGLVIDGKITPTPLGLSSAQSNQVMWDWLKFIIYQLTGINPEPLTGDSLSTAYQSGLLVRQMNMRAKSRISAWENGALRRAITVLGANALSECTVEEWEEITEDDAKRFQESIANDDATAEDYRLTNDNGQKVHEKRVHTMIPVKGYKFTENFKGKNKKRTLNAKNPILENTLVEDPTMQSNTSYVPSDSQYLLQNGDVQTIFQYHVEVDGSGLLLDLKTQDGETMKNAITNAGELAKLDPAFVQELDLKKIYVKSIEPTGMTEDDVFKIQKDMPPATENFANATAQIDAQNSIPHPSQNVQQPQGMDQGQQPAAGGAAPQSGTQAEVGLPPSAAPALASIAA